MKIGYARVSTNEQELGLQISALRNNGCDKIYSEKESAAKDRPILEEVMGVLREGDILVIWKLDRLARSLKQLIFLLDTSTAQSLLYTQIIGAFAQFERALMIERTKAGLEDAKSRGIKLGRRKGLSNSAKLVADGAAKLYMNGMNVLQICELLNISRGTFYRYLKYKEIKLRQYK